MNDTPVLEAADGAGFGAWLAENHEAARQVWLVVRHPGVPVPSLDEAVTEALRFGWIDSTERRLEDGRTVLRFSPRRPGSGWAASNKARIARLEAEGRLEPPGRAAVERARADGSWTLLDSVEALEVPPDLAAALDAAGARDRWEALTRSARKAHLATIAVAKRADTRARRVSAAVVAATGGGVDDA